jgi:hypothetical protein
MALIVSVEQAAANALGAWLKVALGADVVVDTRWPDPGKKLAPRAVTILLAGPPEEELLDPVVVSRADTGPKTALFTWRMRALRQPLQLDVWAQSDLERDDLKQRLRSALNAGMGRTIGARNAMPFRHGVVVALSDGWTGFADCLFDRPLAIDTPDAVKRCEYRLTYRGYAEVDVTETGESPRIVVLHVAQRIRDARRATTITPQAVTHTEES